MADSEFGTPQPITRTHPIVTQAWTPPYAPVALPLQNSWKNVMSQVNTAAAAVEGKKGGRDPRSNDFFQPAQPQSPPRRVTHNSGDMSWAGRTATTQAGAAAAVTPPGAFNVFDYAQKGGATGGTSGLNSSSAVFGRSSTMMVMPSLTGASGLPAMRSLNNFDDGDDEYDERVETLRQAAGGGGVGAGAGHHPRRKTRAAREAAREQHRRSQEALATGGGGAAGGNRSGGEVDEGCVGALGDDDEVRDLRLRFTPGAAHHDGTANTAYATAIYKKRAALIKTPNAQQQQQQQQPQMDGTGGGFVPPGLRTPVYDPTSNMPTPVQRFQRRQQHHLLRMLGGGGPSPHRPAGGGAGPGTHLFSPHEIPNAGDDEGSRRINKFDHPESWLFGRDETVEDVMRRMFAERNAAYNAAMASSSPPPGGAAAVKGKVEQQAPTVYQQLLQPQQPRRGSNGAEQQQQVYLHPQGGRASYTAQTPGEQVRTISLRS